MATTYTDGDDVSLIGFNVDEIVSNDLQDVVVNAELLDAIGTRIDQPKSMRLARDELELR
jgi:hypothetical protein